MVYAFCMPPPATLSCAYCDVLTAWSTLAEALLILVGGAVALLQVRAANDARRLQAALSILQHLENAEFRRGRWFIHNHMGEVNKMLISPYAKHRALINERIRQLSQGDIDLAGLNLFVHMLEDLAFLLTRDSELYNLLIPNMLENMFLADGKRIAEFIAYRQLPENRPGLVAKPSLYARHIILLTNQIERIRGAKRSRFRELLKTLWSPTHNFLTALDQLSDFRERLSVVEEIERLKEEIRSLRQDQRASGPRR